jgi:hypothetical protein
VTTALSIGDYATMSHRCKKQQLISAPQSTDRLWTPLSLPPCAQRVDHRDILLLVQYGQNLKLTCNLHISPRLSMGGTRPSLHHSSFCVASRDWTGLYLELVQPTSESGRCYTCNWACLEMDLPIPETCRAYSRNWSYLNT